MQRATVSRAVRRLAALAVTAALLAGTGLPAQDATRLPQQPVFRVEANYVRVDAYVTDGDRPVRDLTVEDFVVSEDGVTQSITAFEHVEVRGRAEGPPGREPQSVSESREMARDPRSRVFVLFLDTLHTGVGGSHRMQRALVTLLDRILGPDDLVGVMTPDMSAADVTFARRTESIEAMLSTHWTWGRRDQFTKLDPVEQNYETCYPNSGDTAGIAREMIDRRRERLTLDALRDLSIYLRGVREERKAVIAVSDGWLLYEPNRALAERQFKEAGRVVPVPGVGPTGGLTTDVDRARGLPMFSCEQDRIQLSMLDNRRDFMDLYDIANRANVSFYPVDSRGLPVFDEGLDRPVAPVSVDQRRLSNRIESLRTLALNTDGFAVVNNNDIEAGLKRIADDVTSYYLLGYYSSNSRLDGRFRSISVKVKRPGVSVRHRRGYRAATEADVAAAGRSAGGPGAAGRAAEPAAPDPVQSAFGTLAPDRREVRFRSASGWLPAVDGAAAPGARVWVVGELDPATLRAPEWSGGGDVEARLATAAGETLATATSLLAPGLRSFTTDFGETPVPPGDYAVRLRVRPSGGGLPLSDLARVRVPSAASGTASPRVFRRGPTTGGVAVATADHRFRRTERIRVEWPLAAPVNDRRVDLVDRAGRTMPIPVTVSERAEPGGVVPAVVAELALAPLAEGEYALVLRSGTAAVPGDPVVAIRIVQ